MSSSSMKGPGLLYVNSRITSPALTSSQFLKWYTQIHIPDVLATSGVSSALRFESPDPDSQRPFLALYPMSDIGFTQTEEFNKISVLSDLLPKGGPIYDLADFDTRYYALVQYYAPREPKAGETKMLLTGGFEFEDRAQEEECDEWYRKEHLELVSRCRGYLRTTRWKLLHHRSNALSRRLKGIPPHPADVDIQDPPTILALHEFDTTDLDIAALTKTGETEWAKKVMGSAIKTETPVFGFKEYFGNGTLFGADVREKFSGRERQVRAEL